MRPVLRVRQGPGEEIERLRADILRGPVAAGPSRGDVVLLSMPGFRQPRSRAAWNASATGGAGSAVNSGGIAGWRLGSGGAGTAGRSCLASRIAALPWTAGPWALATDPAVPGVAAVSIRTLYRRVRQRWHLEAAQADRPRRPVQDQWGPAFNRPMIELPAGRWCVPRTGPTGTCCRTCGQLDACAAPPAQSRPRSATGQVTRDSVAIG